MSVETCPMPTPDGGCPFPKWRKWYIDECNEGRESEEDGYLVHIDDAEDAIEGMWSRAIEAEARAAEMEALLRRAGHELENCNEDLSGEIDSVLSGATPMADRIAEMEALLDWADGQLCDNCIGPIRCGECFRCRCDIVLSGATPMQDLLRELEDERDAAYRQAEDEAQRCNDFMRQRDDAVCKVSEMEADNARLRAEAERARPVVEAAVRFISVPCPQGFDPDVFADDLARRLGEAVAAYQAAAQQGEKPEEVNMGTQ